MKNVDFATLTENTIRLVHPDGPRLCEKWQKIGLLEGLVGAKRMNMARVLENQAVQLIKEANSLSTGGASLVSSGQITGFSNVAFPMVRKVFAGLLANDLVSVQPMSLPNGLLFYLDYAYGSNVGGDAGLGLSTTSTNETFTRGQSVYGNPLGRNVVTGAYATGGMYDLVGSGYSKVQRQSMAIDGSTDSNGAWISGSIWTPTATVAVQADFTGLNARWAGYDAKIETDITDNLFDISFVHISASEFPNNINGFAPESLEQVAITGFGNGNNSSQAWGTLYQGGTGVMNLRRLNKRGNWNPVTGIFTPDAMGGTHYQFVIQVANAGTAPAPGSTAATQVTASAAIQDALSVDATGGTLTIPSFETDFAINAPSPAIPEVEISVTPVSVTATSRKLRAKWSPEASQDYAAYFAGDLEVELTSLTSDLITLEIDREIVNDLLTQANAANYYWSRAPGKLVNKYNGLEINQSSTLAPGPAFFADVQSWYQTLVETINDVSNVIYRKTLRGMGNFIVTSPDVCTILEMLGSWKSNFKIDSDGQISGEMTIGNEPAGTLNNKYKVYKDPYFPSNRILIGLKGSSFLESGYIYAPYIPLILTPVVYGQEDFTPRRGIMTRYAKKMVRSDFFGSVTVLDMQVI